MSSLPQSKILNILLADDDADDSLFFEQALSSISIPTTLKLVKDGEELMKYLLNEKVQLPDVLFLDLSMPRKTGFECLTEIKENSRFAALHVFVFTTSFGRSNEYEKSLMNTLVNIGAEQYIRKPAKMEQLSEIIHTAILSILDKEPLDTV